MYLLPLILFFISLVGITAMISRKLVLIRNGQILAVEHSHPFVPEIQKIKHLTFKGAKELSFVLLFLVLRFFIKSSNFIKTTSKDLIQKIGSKLRKNKTDELTEKKEASGYLKIISEYRYRIRQMKRVIKQEEGIE